MLTLVRSFGVVTRVEMPEPGRRRFGVPVGGAFDVESLTLALALCGSDGEAWELSQAQATFSVENHCTVAVIGAGVNRVFAAHEAFTIDAPRSGARVYVAYGPPTKPAGWQMRLDEQPSSVANRNTVRVVPGPQASRFDLSVLRRQFTVSRTVNRVGLRLSEPIAGHAIELPSEPSCVGAIQVANDGTLILLGPEGPTIGGYPKIAVVASADISRLGQLAPGDPVRFEVIDIATARTLVDRAHDDLDRRIRLLRIASQ